MSSGPASCPACGGTRRPSASSRSRVSTPRGTAGTTCHALSTADARGGRRRRGPATRARSPTPARELRDWRFDAEPSRPASSDFDRRGSCSTASRSRGRTVAAWLVIQLDLDVISSRVLPELASRYFTGVDGLDYQVALVAGTRPRRVIYSSDPSFAVAGSDRRRRPDESVRTAGRRDRRLSALRVPPAVPEHGAADRGQHGLVPALRRRAAAGRLAAGRAASSRRRARRVRRRNPPSRSDRSASACCCCWSSA